MTAESTRTFYDVVRTKRDLRAYEDRPIPEGVLRRILQAGRMAGSAKHAQPCRFIVLRDRRRREELAACGDFTAHVVTAPVAIAIVTLPEAGQWDPLRATSHRHEDAARVLGLPPDHRVTWVLAFGYPREDALATRPRRPRLPLAEYVHEEHWGARWSGAG